MTHIGQNIVPFLECQEWTKITLIVIIRGMR